MVSPYALETTYFPAFRRAVQQGHAHGVMCSYNAVNGVPTCASPFLSNVLRGAWGFDGYITSDTGAIEDIYKAHHFSDSMEAAACAALVNGTTDVCSGFPYFLDLLKVCAWSFVFAARGPACRLTALRSAPKRRSTRPSVVLSISASA